MELVRNRQAGEVYRKHTRVTRHTEQKYRSAISENMTFLLLEMSDIGLEIVNDVHKHIAATPRLHLVFPDDTQNHVDGVGGTDIQKCTPLSSLEASISYGRNSEKRDETQLSNARVRLGAPSSQKAIPIRSQRRNAACMT